ncbi:hypothetical protein JIN84_10720 [Luteolibacter yonseiensis]|uniref:Uncharacterized protein n=1 Tax=Luteolibacter yonseiensis TaxID=1144680 RepID=A0A934R6D9_9BACT|nr:hypothetical protein [Luteolibacter yonseiensis]MBK1816085.1 hypothetical protein [Luteolibacter yonseiensis]
MRCLTNSEIHKWLAGQGMHPQPLEGGFPVAGDFPIPSERRSRQMLADYLADLLGKDSNKLLEILPCPQDVAEDWEILRDFRAGLNETRPLVATPGHLFKSGDREDFHSLLTQLLGAEQGWSFYIYSAPSRTTILINDRVEVWSPKKGIRNELGRYLVPSQAA